MINAAFEKAAAFKNTYGNREYVSRNIFARRLGSIERELEEAIRKNNVIVTAENVVITHAPVGYHDPYCLSRVNENGAIIDYYHDKNGDIPAFMDINAAQEYAARHGLKIQNSEEGKNFGTQSLVSTEINGEISYFKFTGMYLEDIMSVAADNGSLQGYGKAWILKSMSLLRRSKHWLLSSQNRKCSMLSAITDISALQNKT